jgi:hypothetical protein
MATQPGANGVVQGVVSNLGAFFRHLFPGILIVGAAYIAHPSWFSHVNTYSWQHLAILAVVAVAAGNIWFSVNRYAVHQVFDYFLYFWKVKGPGRQHGDGGYHEAVGKHVASSLCSDIPPRALQHLVFRGSSVLLLYTLGEVGLLCWWWHDPCTLFDRHPCWTLVVSLLIFAAGTWQFKITRIIDDHVVNFRK